MTEKKKIILKKILKMFDVDYFFIHSIEEKDNIQENWIFASKKHMDKMIEELQKCRK